MNKRIGASSSREPAMKGLRSTPSRDNERSRQRDLSKTLGAMKVKKMLPKTAQQILKIYCGTHC